MPVPFGRVVGAATSRSRRQALHRYRTSRPKVSPSTNRAYRDRSAAGRRQGRRPGRPEALRLGSLSRRRMPHIVHCEERSKGAAGGGVTLRYLGSTYPVCPGVPIGSYSAMENLRHLMMGRLGAGLAREAQDHPENVGPFALALGPRDRSTGPRFYLGLLTCYKPANPVGDNCTDDDLFAILPHVCSVSIRPGIAGARFTVDSAERLRRMLVHLLDDA